MARNDLSALQKEVAEQDTVIQGAIHLIDGFQSQIAGLSPDQGSIDALAEKVRQQRLGLANAMLENTPVEGTEPTAEEAAGESGEVL